MCGCCKRATASASARKRCRCVAVGEVAAQEHLQRHHAPQPAVPGLVDDPHAAPAHLRQDLVVAHALGAAPPRSGTGPARADWR